MKTCTYFKSGIGNFIMATPALQALADMDERGKTDICFDYHWAFDPRIPSIISMIEHTPFINRLVKYPGDCQITDFDIWFVTCQSELSKTSAEIKTRLGKDFLWWQTIDWLNTDKHEIDINYDNVCLLGYKGEKKSPFAPVGDYPILEGPRPYIGLCNAAFKAPMWEKKHWPHFRKLAESLKDFFCGTLFGIGGEGELDGVALDHDFCGKLEMVNTIKAISQLDLFITTDTGCMHAADAVGVPLIALFGPTRVKKNGPRGGRSYVLKSDLSCSPCYYTDNFYDCEYAGCMHYLYPEMIMAIARKVMAENYGI